MKKKMQKTTALAAAAVLSAGLFLTACGGETAAPAGDTTEETATSAAQGEDTGDAAGCGKEEIEANSTTEKLSHVMLLCHDTQAKDATVEALPYILEYYTNLGYKFKAIDRNSIVCHHGVQN